MIVRVTAAIAGLVLALAACNRGPVDAADTLRPALDSSLTAEHPASAAATEKPCLVPDREAEPGQRTVVVYFACNGGTPGQLYPASRTIQADVDPAGGALAELLRGPSATERDRGFRSLFSQATAGMVRGVRRSPQGDTLAIDFADFRGSLAPSATPTSFLPGGVMADITWTVFGQFPEVNAIRLSFDGSERAFWSWIAGLPAAPRVFTRADWERV